MLTITVPNPDDEFDMPIYEGAPEKCEKLVPGVYPCIASYTDPVSGEEYAEESGFLITAGYVMEGVEVLRPFYIAPDACNTGPFWCHETAPHTHTSAFWI